MTSGNPFDAPSHAAPETGSRSPSLVRWGAWLAVVAEIVLPALREAAVAAGWVTAESTAWLGMVTVGMQVLAASLLASPARWPVRLVIAAIGVGVLVVVPGAYLGRLQARFVEPGTRLALAGIELSQGVAAALALADFGRRGWSQLVWVGVAGTAVASVLVGLGVLGGVQYAGPVLMLVWLGSRLLRYAGLVRLGAG